MKNLKKVLALVVVFAMMVSTVAFASYPDVDTTADYAGAVELLSALNVLKGDDQGNFNPDNTITRAEFAAVVCRALGLENSANSAKGATMFNDVAADHWATGYINLASQQGIINGKGNGIFDPEGNVTFAEAVKMLVVAIGYEPMAAQRGGYPTGYLTVANSTKMTAGVSAAGTDAAALRSTVAMLTANAMEIPVMDQTGYGTEVTFEVLDDYDNYSTLLTGQDIYTLTGVVGDADEDNDTIEVALSESSDDFEFGYNNKGEAKDVEDLGLVTLNIADSNIKDFYQQNVKVYVYKAAKNEYDVLIAVPSGIGETLTIKGSDLGAKTVVGTDDYVEYYETPEATKATKIYTAEDATTVYLNGSKISATDLADLISVDTDAVIEFVENTDDKYYDIVLVTVYENAIVEEVDAEDPEDSVIKFLGNRSVDLDFEDDDIIIELVDAEGNAMELADFAENDVVAMVVGDELDLTDVEPVYADDFKEKIKIINLGQSSVTGTLTEASDEYIYIDGTEYEYISVFVDGNEDDVFDGTGAAKLGTEGMFYISATGKIIGFDGTAGGNTNYGYILQTNYDDSGFNAGWEIKMLTKEGIATYELYTTVNIDGDSVKAESLNGSAEEFVDFTEKGEYAENVAARIVEYKLTAEGKIKNIQFIGATAVASDADGLVKKEFNESSYKVGGKTLADDVVIFDISAPDADDTKAYDISYLIDEGEYAGYVADDDDEWNVFIMTEGSAKFAAEAGLMYVESVKSSTYGADDAVTVNYYVDGDNEVKSAIFVDTEAYAVLGADFSNLSKGDIFVANVNAEGLVSEYAVVAELNGQKLNVNYDVIEYLEEADEDVAFAYGYIEDVDKKGNVTLGEGAYYTGESFSFIPSKGNEYQFNTKVKKPTVEVGRYNRNGVKPADELDGECYFVFVKTYNDDEVDTYAIGYAIDLDDVEDEEAGDDDVTPSAVEEVVEVEEVEELVFE